MKIFKRLSVSFLVLFFLISLPFELFSAPREKKEQELSPEQQKMMKLWQEMTSPGENHKHLEYFVGEWKSTQKIFQTGQEPTIRKQEISVRAEYGGRFTHARIKVDVELSGQKLEGIVLTGYDNYKKKFVSVTYVNIGTNFSFMSGTLDETGKIRTDYGESDNFMSGTSHKVKAITTILSEDKYTYDYYTIDAEGKETKIMEITYFRQKGDGSPGA